MKSSNTSRRTFLGAAGGATVAGLATGGAAGDAAVAGRAPLVAMRLHMRKLRYRSLN